jgi:glycosyltransferase involved in cell wall biosynthesis
VASFPFQSEKEDHLLLLSRISADKGPHLAVEVARRCGKKLLLAGKVDPADREFFATTMAPLIDGDQVVFVGEADARIKRELYKAASCVLMPITWEEPFGLVLAEAQACGTPVIAFGRGAAPEIVLDGVTGFVVDTVDEMVVAVSRVNEISPMACRQHVEANFGREAMAEGYVRVYESILAAAQAGSVVLPRNGDLPSWDAPPVLAA